MIDLVYQDLKYYYSKKGKDIVFSQLLRKKAYITIIFFEVSSNLGNCFRPQISKNKIVWMDQLGKRNILLR